MSSGGGGGRGGGKGGARGPNRQSAGRPRGGPDRGGPPSRGGSGGTSRGGSSGGAGGRGGSSGGSGRGGSSAGGAGRGGASSGGAGGYGRGGSSSGGAGRGGSSSGGAGRGGSSSGGAGGYGRGGSSSGAGGSGRGRGPGGAPGRGGSSGAPRGGGSALYGGSPRPADAAPPEAPPGPRKQVIYGIHPVEEALRGRRKVHRIWATEAGDWTGRVQVVSSEELEERTGSDGHQGVAALVDPYPYADAADFLAGDNPLIIALDEVTDPQNLGAIARTAEAVGVTGIVIPERRSAEVTPAVCKASAGAVEHVAIAQVRNLADFLGEAKESGCWVYGAAAGAKTRYDQPDYSGGVVAVLGAEGKGLRTRVASMCDDLVSLPLLGRIESLNVSATAAVLLYEMLQQRLDAST